MKTVCTFFLVILFLAIGPVQGQESLEAAKIQYLIDSVGNLEGAKFIRNGKAYAASAAQNHLRLKLRFAGKRVRTAEDFIRFCASRSSETGLPYRIQLADGTIEDAEVFFRERLKTFPGKTVP